MRPVTIRATLPFLLLLVGMPLSGQMRLERTLLVNGHQLELARVGTVLADDSGRIYVADTGAQQIVVLDAAGRHAGTIGRAGGGPGEFGALGTVTWHGNGIAAYDRRGRRVIFLEAAGRETGAVDWPSMVAGFFPIGHTLFSGGEDLYGTALLRMPRVVRDFEARAEPLPPPRPQVLRFAPDGTVHTLPIPHLDPFAQIQGSVDCGTRDGTIHTLRSPFTSRGPLVAFLPDGLMGIAHRDQYRIDIVRTASGEVVRSYHRDVSAIPVTDAVWEAQPEIREVRGIEAERGSMYGLGRTQCPVLERPAFQPVLRTIVSDESGRLWAESTTAQGFALTGIGPQGELLGEAAMPRRDPSVPPYVRGSQLYVVTVDDLDVQSIEVYDIRLD